MAPRRENFNRDSLIRTVSRQLNCKVVDVTALGGGDINQAVRMKTEQGTFFVKWHPSPMPGMFCREREGLEALDNCDAVRVPQVISVDEDGYYLVLEWIEPGGGNGRTMEELGRSLAALHQAGAEAFGFSSDNYIGTLVQKNTWEESWRQFFGEHRLRAQIELGYASGAIPGEVYGRCNTLISRLERWIPDKPEISLLHGDLWGGNYIVSNEGSAVLIDPAVYYGHREVEIAFTRLFGGFSEGFYRGYCDAWPLDRDYQSRQDLYNLYPILVHTNLFGGHYLSRADAIIRRYL